MKKTPATALNDGGVRVQQLGGDVAGLGGGGGILDIIYLHSSDTVGRADSTASALLFCVVDCREMLTVLPLLIVQSSALVLSPLSSRDVPSSLYSVR